MKNFKKIFNPDKLSTFLLYTSIPTFIIAFNFSHNPPSGWYQQFLPNLNGRQITDITFLDSLTGFAVTNNLTSGDTAYIFKTTNGGDNWVINFSNNNAFVKIRFINQSTGFTNAFQTIYKTTNAGENWFAITLPGDLFGEDMFVLNADTIWLVNTNGLVGGVYRTTNGGVSWDRQLNLGSLNPDHIYMFNGKMGFISEVNGGAPYIRKTTNSGQSWFVTTNGQSFRDMHFTDTLKGWRAHGNNMYLTTDGGINWITQELPSGGMILSTGINKFSNINADTIFGAGGIVFYGAGQFRSIIYRTTNGGNNWLYQVPDTSIHSGIYQEIQFVDKLKGWAYWVSGGIHTVVGGDTTFYTGITKQNENIPSDYKLKQNYPNPFNPRTIIPFNLKKRADVKLFAYDIRGREVQQLVNGNYNAGEYEVDFMGKYSPSGVYFYSLFADERLVDTKKMIVLK